MRNTRRRFLLVSLLSFARPGLSAEVSQTSGDRGEPIRLSQLVRGNGNAATTNASGALVAAMRRASTEEREVLVDGRFAIGHDLPVNKGVRLFGRPNHDDGFDLLPPPASITGGVHGHFVLDRGQAIDGMSFEDLTFHGGFDSKLYTGSLVIPVVRVSPRAGVVHKNISIRRCRFIDPVCDCIQASPGMGGRVESLEVVDSAADVTVTLDRASRNANLVRTILEYPDWPGHRGSYGKVVVDGVRIQHCRARGIRTLADLKRGTSNFVVSDCRTEDMTDCHHSADGSFRGVFERIEGIQRSPLIKAKNFIEVQGEGIVIRDFSYHSSSALGAIAGVMITAYALPLEGADAAHQSTDIHIFRGHIVGVSHNAVRLINVDGAEVRDITIDDVKLAAVSVENPRGKLIPGNIVIDDVRPERGKLRDGVFIAPATRGARVINVVGFEHMATGGGHIN